MSAVTREVIKTKCGNAFGATIANDVFVSQLLAKIQTLGLRLGQVYWVGNMTHEEVPLIQFGVKVYHANEIAHRKIRLSQELKVVYDEISEFRNEAGFAQSLERHGDVDFARRQMGDFRF